MLIGLLLLGGLFVGLFSPFLARLVRPKKPSAIKSATYECGVETQGDTWVQFRVSYYIYALAFVIFDIETVFLYPWAVQFKQLGFFTFVEVLVFIAILTIGWWYIWKNGSLEWEK
jgi:NADH-quinone oxidoreductase subunit A